MKSSILAGLTFLGCVSAEKAGISVGVDHEFITYATNTIGPELVDAINSVVIPDIHFNEKDSITKASLHVEKGNPADFFLNYNPQT